MLPGPCPGGLVLDRLCVTLWRCGVPSGVGGGCRRPPATAQWAARPQAAHSCRRSTWAARVWEVHLCERRCGAVISSRRIACAAHHSRKRIQRACSRRVGISPTARAADLGARPPRCASRRAARTVRTARPLIAGRCSKARATGSEVHRIGGWSTAQVAAPGCSHRLRTASSAVAS